MLNTQDAASVTKTITVNSSGIAPFQVTVNPQQGLAPLQTTLTINNRGAVPFQRIEIDTNDDGTPELTLTTLTANKAQVTLNYPTSGTSTVRVTVFDANGNVIYLGRRKVLALDPRNVASGAYYVLTGMLDKLRAGNIGGAFNAITGTMHNKYSAIFTTLQPQLSTIVDQLGTIQGVTVTDEVAEFRLGRTTVNGSYTFGIYLVRCEDGIWRIDGM